MGKSFSSLALQRLDEITAAYDSAFAQRVAERAQHNRNNTRPYTTPWIIGHDIDTALTEIVGTTNATQKGEST